MDDPNPLWRQDLAQGYALFATQHVEKLTSREILGTALAAMNAVVAKPAPVPRFTEASDAVPADLEEFLATVDGVVRANPAVSPLTLRDAAFTALVALRPDPHTVYWLRIEDSPVYPLLQGRCEIRSELRPGAIGCVSWDTWLVRETFDIVAEVRARLDVLVHDGAKGWLFDLRGNRGGSAALKTASMFLEGGQPLVRRTHRDGTIENMLADGSLRLPESYQLPIAVVVDHQSWSATELFAFTLRQNGRAILVGERTAGFVGSINGDPLPGGGFVGVKVMHVTGPNGEVYNRVGVMPDIEAAGDDAVGIAERLLREKIAAPAGAARP